MRQHTDSRQTNLPGFGLVLGTGIGTVIGIFFNQIAVGAAFGSALGLLSGATLDMWVNRRSQD